MVLMKVAPRSPQAEGLPRSLRRTGGPPSTLDGCGIEALEAGTVAPSANHHVVFRDGHPLLLNRREPLLAPGHPARIQQPETQQSCK